MGGWTFAVVFMAVLGIFLFFVPGNSEPSTLDTSHLTEMEDRQSLPDKMKESIPTSYEAPSTEVALEAIPFDLILPEKLPFDAEPFKVMDLLDWREKDGKEIKIELTTIPKNNPHKGWVTILASDVKNVKRNLGSSEKMELDNKIVGHFKELPTQKTTSIYWTVNGVFYSLNYMNAAEKYDKIEHKKTLESLANEMIHKMDKTK